MKATVRNGLSNGDTVELGEEIHETRVEQTRGGLNFSAVHSGETEEFVLLSTTLSNGEELDMDGEVLAVVSGIGTHGPPRAWVLVPVEEYGGGA